MGVAGPWGGVRFLIKDWLSQSVQWIPYVSTGDVWVITPALIGVAFLLAAISSIATLSRSTKV